MKTITLKNADGDSIEIKRGPEDQIHVRHSALDAKTFGEFRDGGEVAKSSAMRDLMLKKGMNPDDPLMVQAKENSKGMTWLNLFNNKPGDEMVFVSPEDAQLIREAIKQLD